MHWPLLMGLCAQSHRGEGASLGASGTVGRAAPGPSGTAGIAAPGNSDNDAARANNMCLYFTHHNNNASLLRH